MEKIERIGVSLEKTLLAQFDSLIELQGYHNRSEAIRDLIRERLTQEKLGQPQTKTIAAVFIVYDHHRAQLAQKLIKLQHNRLLETISSMHIHLDHHNCLEIILLKGKVSDITKLGNQLIALKGVKLGKVNLVCPAE